MKVSSDQPAADGVDHVFMQRLKAQKLAAFIFQSASCLVQLGCQCAGQMRHRQVSKKVDQDHYLERLQVAAPGNLKRLDLPKIGKLQQASKKNEADSCRYIRPVARQQNRRNDDDQRIKEVEES